MSRSGVNTRIIVWATAIGGFFSSLVKWGSEVNMPPRVSGEISPPAAHIDAWLGWAGVNSHSLDYVFQGTTVTGLVTAYHWGFSFLFAGLYVTLSAFWSRVRAGYGAVYGLAITLVMHGFLIPLLGFRNPSYAHGTAGWLWNLNKYELSSELAGHICWSVSIEICLITVLAHYGKPVKGPWA